MVTKTVEMWANIYPNGNSVAHTSKQSAEKAAEVNNIAGLTDRIACVKLTGSYEVEE
jgi:hypothetical protein